LVSETLEVQEELPLAPPVEAPASIPDETPVIDIGESQEEDVEEAPAAVEETPDPVTALQAKIDSLTEKIDAIQSRPSADPDQIRQAERDRLRVEQDIRDEQEKRAKADREEMHDAIKAVMVGSGDTDVEPTTIERVAERFINKRYDQIANKEIAHVSEALKWVRGFAESGSAPSQLTGRAAQYAGQFAEDFNAIYGKLRQQAQDTGDLTTVKTDELVKRLSADQIKAIADNEIARRNAVANTGKKPLARADGTPSTVNTNTVEYWDSRIAHQGEEGFPMMTDQEYATARKVRAANGL